MKVTKIVSESSACDEEVSEEFVLFPEKLILSKSLSVNVIT